MALFFLMLLGLISAGLYRIVPTELYQAGKNKIDVQAHYACTSGLKAARLWLSAVITPDSTNSTIDALGDDPGTWGNTVAQSGVGSSNSFNATNEPFAVPASDPTFSMVTLDQATAIANSAFPGTLASGQAGLGLSGLNTGSYCLCTRNLLKQGDYSTYTVIVPADQYTPGYYGYYQQTGQSRCYIVVATTYLFQTPILRAKATFKEDSFAKFALFVDQWPSYDSDKGDMLISVPNDPNAVVIDGPAHTNSYWRISVDQNYWDSSPSSTSNKAFRNVLSYSSDIPTATLAATNLNKDGVAWAGGNWNGTDTNRRPFDDSGAPIAQTQFGNRYNRLITGGESNIRKSSTIPLPANAMSIATAAFGDPTVTGVPVGQTPASQGTDGFFVQTKNGTNQAAGGLYIKGNTSQTILEVVDANGHTVTNDAALQAGTASGNPSIRAQMSQESVKYSTNFSTTTTTGSQVQSVTSTTTNYSTTTGTTTTTNKSTTYTTTTSTSTNKSTNYTTTKVTSSALSTATSTSYSTAFSASTNYGSTTTISYVTNYVTSSSYQAGGSGSSGGKWVFSTTSNVVPTGTTTNKVATSTTKTPTGTTTNKSTSVSTNYTTQNTGTSTSYSTGTGTTTNKSGVGTTTTKATSTGLATTSSKSTSTMATGTVWTTSTGITSSTSSQVWRPIDQLIETKNQGVTIGATGTQGGTGWAHGVGASDTAATSRVISVSGTTTQFITGRDMNGVTVSQLYYNGVLQTSPVAVSTGKAVLIKQSRTDPNRFDMFVIDAPSGSSQALNGAVYSENTIGNLNGVNLGAKTIAAETGNGSNIYIRDNLWQFGTARGAQPTGASNGLGLIGENILLSANENNFSTLSTNPLYIYAVMMAGHASGAGGFGEAYMYGLTKNQNPYLKLYGGLLERQGQIRYVSDYSGAQGVGNYGWNQNFTYDQQLANSPPPFFPKNNLLIPTAYSEERL